MKICFITSKNITSHATLKRAIGMANPLCTLGHEVTICLQEAEDNKEAMKRCPLAKSYYYQPGSALYERRQKQAFLEQNKFDIVHICGLGVGNSINSKPLKSSFVIIDHDELESSTHNRPLRRRISQNYLEWWSLFAYDGSVVASKYLESLFVRRLNLFRKFCPILYLPYGYDSDSLTFDKTNVYSLQAKYPRKKIIVFLGSLLRQYGCFEMLEAFSILAKNRSDFVALICGRGSEEIEAISFVKQNNLEQFIVFKGYIPETEVPTVLYGANILMCPLNDTVTDWARCPSKLLMYMVTKKPIVTCAIGEAREYLGEDGFYYKPSDPESMASAIQTALDTNDWFPKYDSSLHTWQQRVDTWLNWIRIWAPSLVDIHCGKTLN